MHPLAWMAWAGGAGLAALSTTNVFYLAPLFASAFVVYAAHRRPGPGARAFKVFALWGGAALVTRTALVLFGPITTGSITAAALEGARIAVLLAVYGTFNAVTNPTGILKLAPRRFHEPALAAALALSIAPRTIESVGRVREAQRLRGIEVSAWRGLPALAVPVLEGGMEEAVTLAESMDARGHGRGPRTRYRPRPWTAQDGALCAAVLAATSIFVGFLARGGGDLDPAFVPLRWPEASAWLVAAAFLFGAAALLPQPDART